MHVICKCRDKGDAAIKKGLSILGSNIPEKLLTGTSRIKSKCFLRDFFSLFGL